MLCNSHHHLSPEFFTFLSWNSVQFSCSVVPDSLRPHEPHHARPPCPSPTPRVYPNPCPLSWWCHPTISSSVVPFSSRPQSFPSSGSFQMSQLFASGGQSIGASALSPLNSNSQYPLLPCPPVYFLTMNLSVLDTSYEWFQTVFYT